MIDGIVKVVAGIGATLALSLPGITSALPYEIPFTVKFGPCYSVARGDTLGGIAKELSGNSQDYRRLMEWNNIFDPKKLTVGAVLSVPIEGPNPIFGEVLVDLYQFPYEKCPLQRIQPHPHI